MLPARAIFKDLSLTKMLHYKKTHFQDENAMALKSYSHFCRWCVFIGHTYSIMVLFI